MKTNTDNPQQAAVRTRTLLCLACLLGGVAIAPAQEFKITGTRIAPDGRILIQYPATTNSYYLLYRGELTNITLGTDAKLGVDGLGELVGVNVRTNGSSAFFRVRQVPLDQPLDSDGDGWDDATELAAASNPLDRTSRPFMMVSSAPATALLLPSPQGGEGLANNTVVATPPAALLLPMPTGYEGMALNTFVALPPASLLLPIPTGAEGMALNTFVALPPAALMLPLDQGAAGLPLSTQIAQPPVSVQINVP